MKICVILLVIISITNCYNQTLAKTLIKMACISHCTNDQINNWNCKLCRTYPHMTNLSVIQNNHTKIKGFVGYDNFKKTIIVSWRGTIDNINWIEDADFKFIDYSGCSKCKIHEGFYNAYMSVSALTNDKIKYLNHLYPQATITITGHSLGCALAYVTILSLYKTYPQKIKEFYGYGCPRLGNSEMANYIQLMLKDNIFRVVHYKDIVPHLPPMDFGYKHTPFQIFYNEEMTEYKVCDKSGQDHSCSDGAGPIYNPNDHGIYWYKTDDSIC